MKLASIKDCYYPLLFSIWPVVFLYSHNIDQVPATDILLPAIITVGFSSLAWFFLNIVVKNLRKSAFIITAFIALFFSYGLSYNLLQDIGFELWLFSVGPNKIITILGVTLLGAGVYFALKTRRPLDKLTKVLNGVSVVLVILPVINIGFFHYKIEISPELHRAPSSQPATVGVEYAPDIYYIILDAYARADVLEEVFGYDNSAFLDYLRDKGFFVAEGSVANYPGTYASIASTLNMGYLDDFLSPEQTGHSAVMELWNNSEVVEFLKQRGYLYVFMPTAGFFTWVRDMDVYLERGIRISHYFSELINTTPLANLLPLVLCRYSQHRNSLLFAFDKLGDLDYLGSPRFVYAHIMSPHQPFVFDEYGNPITPDYPYVIFHQRKAERDREGYLEGYRQQLIFTNKKIMEVIDRLLEDSERPPIIILQADHGPPGDLGHDRKSGLQIRFPILNAYYLPDNAGNQLYGEITPVNTFRLIFDEYFGAEYGLLEDKAYSTVTGEPYRYIEVTEILNMKE